MVDVDKKILKCLETKKIALDLRKEVENLKNLITDLEDIIAYENMIASFLDEEIIVSIKIGDLITKISTLLNIDRNDIDVKITVLNGTYACSLMELYNYKNNNSKLLNSYLSVKLKDGTNIFIRDLRLFNSLNEIQADGSSLLDHCCLEKKQFQKYDLVVYKNVDDIICNFRLDAADMEKYEGDERVLPLAIRECINDKNIIESESDKKVLVKAN